jgi:Transcriptional regulator, AbiEi antitoxin, Type IV TA system/Transcriptional regulator, AbiEi antitoxin N-terminal domain
MKAKEIIPLEKVLPEGLLVDRDWLQKNGFNRPRVDSTIRSRKLEAVVRGLYRRPGPPLKWEQVVYSLCQMGHPVHVGGYTALIRQGMGHYVHLSQIETINLYGASKAPSWLAQYRGGETVDREQQVNRNKYSFEFHTTPKFRNLTAAAILSKPFGTWDWLIPYSTPELAFVEMLDDIKDEADFEKADKTFEAAATLRPGILNEVLSACRSVKTKRLLFWFGARHKLPWFADLDRTRIDLGKGKRMLVRGGVFDSQFEITVPKGMARGTEQPLY